MIRPNFALFAGGTTVIIHSAKGSTWKDHKYIKKKDGTYYYPKDYKGGSSKSSNKDSIISQLEDITGMKREGLLDLWDLSRNKGYDSAEYKELLNILSEGDDDQAKRMEDLLKSEKTKDKPTGEYKITKDDYEILAKEVIKGNFDNGASRKELLGEHYAEVQKLVNQMMKSKK